MNILIFSGGTGSVALQTGIYKKFGNLANVSILINALDNGLSTGAVRQAFDGNILGPSDLRKNQMLRHKLIRGETELYTSLNIRFDKHSNDVYEYCFNWVDTLKDYQNDAHDVCKLALRYYFANTDYKSIDYTDFSISNIIYASLAAMNNNSLAKAGEIMEQILDIPSESVILNSDDNVYLRARTKSGITLFDESDIVDWNSDDDIVDIMFVDNNGNSIDNQKLSDQSIRKINEADIIIFSTGTQWSSLIPTYATTGIKELIENSNAKKYFIMNNIPDKDMQNANATDILNLVNRWVNLDDFTVVYNDFSSNEMKDIPDLYDTVYGYYAGRNDKIHNPLNIIIDIFNHYYKEYITNSYVFDYDDTLVARRHSNDKTSDLNLNLLNALSEDEKNSVYICSGNDIKILNTSKISEDITIFADGGVIEYSKKSFRKPIDSNILLSNTDINSILDALSYVEIVISKIENRSNVMIAIRNIDNNYRKLLVSYLKLVLPGHLNIRKAGLSTIEIIHKDCDKSLTINMLDTPLTYIGDEFDKDGNDYPVLEKTDAKCLKVKCIEDTSIFLLTISGGEVSWMH